ncbi:MAG: zf-HC2 domain-containing protein [Actinomycetota bacterium]
MAGMTPVSEHLSMLLSCYLDGSLTPDELTEVVVALEHDEDAIAEFRRLKETRRALRLMPMLDVPLDLLPGQHLGEQLSAYLDGELITAEMPAVTAHLDTCPECRRELADLDRSRIAVRALPGLEPPAFLEVHREKKSQHRRGLRTAVAVASGVAAVTLAFTVGPLAGEPEPTAVSISDLQFRHTAVDSTASTGIAVQVASTP